MKLSTLGALARGTEGSPRLVARVSLVVCLMAAMLPLGLAAAGAGMAGCSQPGSGSPTPSGSVSATPSSSEGSLPESTAGGPPSIQILNPIADGSTISDRFDGRDETYPIVVTVSNVPEGAAAEAAIALAGGGERPIGLLCPVASKDASDTLQYLWDVPSALPEGAATLRVRLFSNLSDQAVAIAADEVAVDLQHRTDPNDVPSADAINLTWPRNDDALGFYKSIGIDRPWVTVIDGVVSDAAANDTPSTEKANVKLYYTTTPIGADPKFVQCGGSVTAQGKSNTGFLRFSGPCTLAPGDVPSSVTAVGATLKTTKTCCGTTTTQPTSKDHTVSDAGRVRPYIQSPSLMTLSVAPVDPVSRTASNPSGRRLSAGLSSSGCLTYRAIARDQLARPVVGVNVDVALSGPSDVVQFGAGPTLQSPETAPLQEEASNCAGGTSGTQAREIVPNGSDRKVAESAGGTDGQGGWTFKFYSPEAGLTEIRAWIDDNEIPSETTDRPLDNDVHDATDASTTSWGQWLDGGLKLTLSPRNDAASTGTCHLYTVTASAGTEPLAGLNLDIHARMPERSLTLCYADGAQTLTPADDEHQKGHVHTPMAGFDSVCDDTGPPCVHMEGTTDQTGKLVFGVSSGVPGVGKFQIWSDGEPESNDDTLKSPEVTLASTTSFAGYAHQATIRLVNPSNATAVGAGKISSSFVPVMARVDAPYHVPSVSVYLARTPGGKYQRIGEAKRVGHTDTYLFEWNLNIPMEQLTATPSPKPSPSPTRAGRPSQTPTPAESSTPTPLVSEPAPRPSVSSPPPPPSPPPANSKGVPDGTYTLRVAIDGSGQIDTANLIVNRVFNPQGDDKQPELPPSSVVLGLEPATPLGFADGVAYLSGVASKESEGVELLYSTSTSREALTWRVCGFYAFPGSSPTGSTSRPFSEAPCRLAPETSGRDVTAIGALSYSCNVPQGTCAEPSPAPILDVDQPARPGGVTAEAGTAVRVLGCNVSPCITLAPVEWQGDTGSCQAFEVRAADEQGSAFPNLNIDVAIKGPGDGSRFCQQVPGVSAMRPSGQGDPFDSIQRISRNPAGPDAYQMQGETDAEGRFTFGVFSSESDYQSIFATTENSLMSISAWLDLFNDDQKGEGEIADTSLMHWLLPNRCTVVGTQGDDVLVGTVGDDKICGMGGNDVVFAQEGNDFILGGAGVDELWGDEGEDRILGQADNDILYGGPGADKLDGGAGENTCPDYRTKRDARIRDCVVPPKQPI